MRQLTKRLPRDLFAVVEHACIRFVERAAAELFQDFDQAPFAGPRRRDLGVEIAEHQLGHSGIEADQLKDFLVRLSAPVDLCPGKNQALLVHVSGIQHVAGILGAEIHPMGADACISERPIVSRAEDRREQGDIHRVRGAPVWIVHQHDVARLECMFAHVGHTLADGVIVGPKEEREPGCLGDEILVPVVDRNPEVEHLVDDRVERRPDQRTTHLLRGRHEIAADHLDRRAVQLAHVRGSYVTSCSG